MTQQERVQFWHQQIDAWQMSGLSGQAFCKQHDLAYHRFVYWRKKQSRTQPDQSASAAGFVRVVRAQSTSGAGQLTLALPNGASITGIQADNVGLLGAILRQL